MSDDGSEYVSNHDRGAFGKLMADARDGGARHLQFDTDLLKDAEDQTRWVVVAFTDRKQPLDLVHGSGRTGEEALRRLVEKLRT